jgi:hypothetical protein
VGRATLKSDERKFGFIGNGGSEMKKRVAKKTTGSAKAKVTHHPKRKTAKKLHRNTQPADYVLE